MALSGTSTERKASSRMRKLSARTVPMTSGRRARDQRREIVVRRGDAADVGGDALAARRVRDHGRAEPLGEGRGHGIGRAMRGRDREDRRACPILFTRGGATDFTPSGGGERVLQPHDARIGGARLPGGLGEQPRKLVLERQRPLALVLEAALGLLEARRLRLEGGALPCLSAAPCAVSPAALRLQGGALRLEGVPRGQQGVALSLKALAPGGESRSLLLQRGALRLHLPAPAAASPASCAWSCAMTGRVGRRGQLLLDLGDLRRQRLAPGGERLALGGEARLLGQQLVLAGERGSPAAAGASPPGPAARSGGSGAPLPCDRRAACRALRAAPCALSASRAPGQALACRRRASSSGDRPRRACSCRRRWARRPA